MGKKSIYNNQIFSLKVNLLSEIQNSKINNLTDEQTRFLSIVLFLEIYTGYFMPITKAITAMDKRNCYS